MKEKETKKMKMKRKIKEIIEWAVAMLPVVVLAILL